MNTKRVRSFFHFVNVPLVSKFYSSYKVLFIRKAGQHQSSRTFSIQNKVSFCVIKVFCVLIKLRFALFTGQGLHQLKTALQSLTWQWCFAFFSLDTIDGGTAFVMKTISICNAIAVKSTIGKILTRNWFRPLAACSVPLLLLY